MKKIKKFQFGITEQFKEHMPKKWEAKDLAGAVDNAAHYLKAFFPDDKIDEIRNKIIRTGFVCFEMHRQTKVRRYYGQAHKGLPE